MDFRTVGTLQCAPTAGDREAVARIFPALLALVFFPFMELPGRMAKVGYLASIVNTTDAKNWPKSRRNVECQQTLAGDAFLPTLHRPEGRGSQPKDS